MDAVPEYVYKTQAPSGHVRYAKKFTGPRLTGTALLETLEEIFSGGEGLSYRSSDARIQRVPAFFVSHPEMLFEYLSEMIAVNRKGHSIGKSSGSLKSDQKTSSPVIAALFSPMIPRKETWPLNPAFQ